MIIARIGSDSTWIPIRVERIAVSRVNIAATPALTSLRVGDSARATASAYDSNGNEVFSRPVEWSIAPESIAAVDAAGVVRARAEGTAKLIASVEATRDTVSVTILARPRPVPVDTPKVEVRGTEVKTPPAPAPGGISAPPVTPPSPVTAIPPLSVVDVSRADSQIIRAITSRDVQRVRTIYLAGTTEDARRLRVLTRAMEGASNVRLISDTRNDAPDLTPDADPPTARIRRTLEFASRFERPRLALELELTFTRDGSNWRLRAFRIMNNISY